MHTVLVELFFRITLMFSSKHEALLLLLGVSTETFNKKLKACCFPSSKSPKTHKTNVRSVASHGGFTNLHCSGHVDSAFPRTSAGVA